MHKFKVQFKNPQQVHDPLLAKKNTDARESCTKNVRTIFERESRLVEETGTLRRQSPCPATTVAREERQESGGV